MTPAQPCATSQIDLQIKLLQHSLPSHHPLHPILAMRPVSCIETDSAAAAPSMLPPTLAMQRAPCIEIDSAAATPSTPPPTPAMPPAQRNLRDRAAPASSSPPQTLIALAKDKGRALDLGWENLKIAQVPQPVRQPGNPAGHSKYISFIGIHKLLLCVHSRVPDTRKLVPTKMCRQ